MPGRSHRRSRFIPAPAGNATRASIQAIKTFGSSPRLRGTRLRRRGAGRDRRFIPAPAGNASSRSSPKRDRSVHPRACGERMTTSAAPAGLNGSSPRLRGTQCGAFLFPAPCRFIPAPAGNARCSRLTCGTPIGSSPRLRGTHASCRVRLRLRRFIPAPAGNAPPLPAPRRAPPVHPRACGERYPANRPGTVGCGSSPRLRGTQVHAESGAGFGRFIPAPAGNASVAKSSSHTVTVHPRACGERSDMETMSMAVTGSSPRLRGTRHQVLRALHGRRFIPAPAGNAAALSWSSWWHRGSSPRLRGTRAQGRHVGELLRFIPAPAGNALLPHCSSWKRAVHPRACGERPLLSSGHRNEFGSSPRLRGTLVCTPMCVWKERFIPAPAGNACGTPARKATAPVHPRACGERENRKQPMGCERGSSPRLRGTHPGSLDGRMIGRFIPAPAGNANQRSRIKRQRAVHPRACGERSSVRAISRRMLGSSPRLRGTRVLEAQLVARARFIPAPAGNAGSLHRYERFRTVHPRACGERTKRNRLSYKKKIGHEKSTEFFC